MIILLVDNFGVQLSKRGTLNDIWQIDRNRNNKKEKKNLMVQLFPKL